MFGQLVNVWNACCRINSVLVKLAMAKNVSGSRYRTISYGESLTCTLKCRLRGESPYNFLTFFRAAYPTLGVGVCAPYPSY